VTLEDIIVWMQSLSPLLVYALVFAIAFIENVFPPSPSDTIIVFGGSLVGIGHTGFHETLLAATLGSTLGFMTMYQIGKWFGARILEQGKVKFIPASSVQTVGEWFRKYGYWLIIGNRFLSGTRAVVSFFAGMSKLNLAYTTALCFLSALAWNGLLVTAGFYLGKNWERIGFYLSTYSQVVTGILIVGAVVLIARFLAKKNGKNA
jgi:membrane protein DedA with SNARE-associated domain